LEVGLRKRRRRCSFLGDNETLKFEEMVGRIFGEKSFRISFQASQIGKELKRFRKAELEDILSLT
jgi:hypothetical protein